MGIIFALKVYILFNLCNNFVVDVMANNLNDKKTSNILNTNHRHLEYFRKRSLNSIDSNNLNVKNNYKYSQSIPSSFAILVNFGIDGKRRMLFSSNTDSRKCEDKQIWDPFNNQCRQLYCSAHFTLIDFKCVEDTINTTIVTNLAKPLTSFLDANSKFVNITLGFLLLDPISDPNEWISSQNVSFQTEFTTNFAKSFAKLSTKRIANVTYSTSKQNLFYVNFILMEDNSPVSHKNNNNDAILPVLSTVVNQEALEFNLFDNRVKAITIHTTLSEFESFCSNDTEMPIWYSNSQFYLESIGNLTYLIVNQTGRRYSPGQYLGNILYIQNIQMFDNSDENKANVSSNAVVCESQTLIDESCTRILLNRSEYDWIDSPNGWTFLKTKSGQYHDRFELAPNGTFVCLQNYTTNNTQEFIEDLVEDILSTVLIIISISALTCVLITYLIFESLRSTISGFNTINLSVCIELMQIMFLSGPHIMNCRISAIVLQFVLLLTISWSSVIAYDMYRTFGIRKIKIRSKNVRKLRFIYWFIANIFATIVIIISIICEKYSPLLNPNYGELGDASGCWIRNPLATFLFFGVPLIINLLINLILYMMTVCQVRIDLNGLNNLKKVTRIPSDSSETSNRSSATERSASTTSTTSLSHKSRPNSMVIFTRLGVLMGFTWIIALIIALVPQKFQILLKILSYIFVILNTSQGVVIFIAFLCNSRVAKLWKNLLKL